MKKRLLQFKPNIAIRFALPYLLIVCILFLVSGFIAQQTYQLVLNQNCSYYQLALENTMNIIDRSLSNAISFADSLNRYEPLTTLLFRQKQEDTAALIQLKDEMLPFTDVNNVAEGYLIYDFQKDMIFTPKRIYRRPAWYYGSLLYYNDFTYEEYKGMLFTQSNQRRFIQSANAKFDSDISHDYLLYIIPYLNLRDNGEVIGQVVFYLREDFLLASVSNLLSEKPDIFMQLLYGDTILSGTDNHFPVEEVAKGWKEDQPYGSTILDGERYYLIKMSSSGHGLELQVGIPAYLIEAETHVKLRFINLCMFLLILFVSAVAVWTIVRNVQPLRGVARHTRGKGDDMYAVEQTLNQLEGEKNSLAEKVSIRNFQLRDALFRQIVYGLNTTETEIEMQLEYAGTPLECHGEVMQGVYLVIDDETNDVDQASMLDADQRYERVSSALIAYRAYLQPLLLEERNQLALIFYADKQDSLQLFHELYSHMKNTQGIYLHFYLGRRVSHLRHVHDSFSDARRLMHTDTQKAEHYLMMSTDQREKDRFRYSAQDEERMLNMVDSADMEGLKNLLAVIYRHNFEERTLSTMMCEMLYYRMISTLMQAEYFLIPDQTVLLKPRGDIAPGEFFQAYRAHLEQMCDLSKQEKQKKRLHEDAEVLTFIREHAMDSNLSISLIASQFGHSESYTSLRIKSLLDGQPFSSYLETLRIEQANKLLLEGKLNITAVGEAVGYNSVTAFGRAYKRVMGCTPGEYQQKKKAGVKDDAF